jgi:hypothetical protein
MSGNVSEAVRCLNFVWFVSAGCGGAFHVCAQDEPAALRGIKQEPEVALF